MAKRSPPTNNDPADESWFEKQRQHLNGEITKPQNFKTTDEPSKPSELVVGVLQVDDWTDPQPIFEELLPVKKLTSELIPEPLRPWIKDIANGMQSPVDYVAAAVVVIVGSVIGAGCGIRPKQNADWLETPNLWGAIVGEPGRLKTPAIKKVLSHLSKLEQKAKILHQDKLKDYKIEYREFEIREKSLEKEMESIIKPAKPSKPKSNSKEE